jgi:hypothetical protein
MNGGTGSAEAVATGIAMVRAIAPIMTTRS